MSRLTSEHHGILSRSQARGWSPFQSTRREERRDSGAGLMMVGLVAIGLGVAAWYILAPDLKRYMKIRNM